MEELPMKKIKIRHFGGKRICVTWDEVVKTLEQIVVGSNKLSQFFFVFPPPTGGGNHMAISPGGTQKRIGR